MNELRELVRKYLAGEVDYPEFRRAMVVGFQSRRNADSAVQAAVNAIGDALADFSENLLSVAALKKSLTVAIAESDPQSNAIVLFRGGDLVPFVLPWFNNPWITNPGLNVKWLEVGTVLFAVPLGRESSVVYASVEQLRQ